MSDLESILNGDVEDVQEEQEPVQEAVQEPEPEPEETAEAPEGETQGEPPTPEVEERMVPQAALLDERRKRQELEAKLNADKKAPDIFEDQEAYTKHMQSLVSQQVMNERANISEFLARREFPDLDDKVAKFQELVEQNPALKDQVINSVSPYHELVDVVTKAQELEQLKDVDSYKEKLRAEVEAEIKAKYEAGAKKSQEKRESIPPSLDDVPTKGSLKGTNWSGPTSLDSIIG